MQMMRWLMTIVLVLSVGLPGLSFAEETTLDVVKKRGVLIGGTKTDYPPFHYTEKDGRLAGFDVDVLEYLAKKLGVKLDLRPVTSANRTPMLLNGTVDIIVASFTITIEREKVVDFSIPYAIAGGSFLVRKGSGIKGYADLAGKTVTFTQGTPWEKKVLKEQPKAKVLVFQDKPHSIMAVKQGKADAYVDDDAPLAVFAKEHTDLEAVSGALDKSPMGIAVRQNDSKWRDFVNFTLIEMWEDGTYKASYRKHFGVDPDPQFKIYPWKL